MSCGICDLTWDVNDPDPPQCKFEGWPCDREWEIAADKAKIETYKHEPKMYNKLMSMHMELLAKEKKVTNHKRRVEDFSIEQLDAGDFEVRHKVVNDLADDTDNIPKHIADHYSAMDEDLAGNVIEAQKKVVLNTPASIKVNPSLMKFCPASGEIRPYPSEASQWREHHGECAWLFNPWSGIRRDARDVGSDCFGYLIEEK